MEYTHLNCISSMSWNGCRHHQNNLKVLSGLDLNAGTPLSFGNASLPSTWRQCWNATNVSASITAVTSSPEAVDHAHWIDQLDIAQQSDRRR
ncbi:hypothetical protein HBH56_232590 [Parastagonospora nodorum]|nr:hypothetical protein HBH56_232590 [Parastagonospora nodorum]KAH4008711.1 hypothetical protein HBI13_231670 [Parastagonospora nodorum]KAH4147769.1 hypothetical protein HBH44_219660 [Parastagonospora nodorum]KAH4401630.1 hypothetical protein HBH92_221940 [Parastagonospora nodorum]KAH4486108.1 hypothetical protein HBH89_212140 [Parastagonospora nodorum]